MVNNKYLVAARDLLIRFGKPMHYRTIAIAAIKLGLLESEGSTPDKTMSSALSREIANNPNTIFKKLRAGVYDIVPGVRLGYEIANYNQIGIRILKLRKQIGIRNEHAIIRRSLFLLKRLFEYAEDDKKITIGNDTKSVTLKLDNKDSTLKNLNLVSVYEISDFRSCAVNLNIKKDICIVLEKLRSRSGLKSILEVVDFGIMILELCARLHKDGSVVLRSKKGSCSIRIFTEEK